MSQNKQNQKARDISTTTKASEEPKFKPFVGKVTAEYLNKRSEPSLNADILEVIEKDTDVKIVDICGEWYKTDDGYVMAQFIKA